MSRPYFIRTAVNNLSNNKKRLIYSKRNLIKFKRRFYFRCSNPLYFKDIVHFFNQIDCYALFYKSYFFNKSVLKIETNGVDNEIG